MEEILEGFGLTKTEAKVYLALTRLGSTPAGPLIKKTQLHRATVYDVLERLIKKGLASFIIKNNKKHYEASPPERFLDMVNEEKKLIEEKEKTARRLVKKLDSIELQTEEKSIAHIYLGRKGLKALMNDIINEGKDFMVFGAEGRFEDSLKYHTKQWAKMRRKENIRAKMIYTEGTRAAEWKMNEVRFVPKEYSSPVATLIYGNKVAITLNQEDPILIILIESEKVAKSYRSYFKLLWKASKP